MNYKLVNSIEDQEEAAKLISLLAMTIASNTEQGNVGTSLKALNDYIVSEKRYALGVYEDEDGEQFLVLQIEKSAEETEE